MEEAVLPVLQGLSFTLVRRINELEYLKTNSVRCGQVRHPHLPKGFAVAVYRHFAIVSSIRGNGKSLFDDGKPHHVSVPGDGCVKVGYADANVIARPGMTDCT